VNALVALILKLSEALFKPVFLKLMEWVTYEDAKQESRSHTWLVILNALADTLKVCQSFEIPIITRIRESLFRTSVMCSTIY